MLRSSDGETFGDKLVLREEAGAHFADPIVSVAGDTGVVAWRRGDEETILGSQFKYTVWVMLTPDRGASWTEPVRVETTSDSENISSIALASDAERVAVAFAVTGEDINNDAREVCVTTLVR